MLGRTDAGSPTGGWITDPVVVGTGELVFASKDLSWPQAGFASSVQRLYRHQTDNQGGASVDFGYRFHTNLRMVVDESVNELTATVNIGNGLDLLFVRPSTTGTFVTPAGWEQYALSEVGGTQYKLTDRDGTFYKFQVSTDPAKVIDHGNRYGVGVTYDYNAGGHVTQINRYSGKVGVLNDIFVKRDTAQAITRIHDYAGRTVDYSYDSNSNLTKAQDACGSCTSIPTAEYAYDGSHRITTIKDANSATIRTITYSGGGSGQVSTSTDAGGGVFTFVYGTPNLAIDPNGHTTEYTFDGSGNLTTKKFKMEEPGSGDDRTYIYQYDSSRRATHATLPSGATVTQGYDSRGNLLNRIVTADGRSVTKFGATYEATYNQPTAVWDGSANTTQYAYNAGGALTREIRPGALTTTYLSDMDGMITARTDPNGKVQDYAYDTYSFGTRNRIDTAGLNLTKNYTVDLLGRRLTNTSPEGRAVTMAYNKGGKVTKHTGSDGLVTNYEYDSNLRQTVRKIMEGASPKYTWTNSFDTAGRLTRTIVPGSETTTYAYDLAGRRTKQTAPGDAVSEWVYDKLGRVVTTRHGDSGGTQIRSVMTYDSMGNVVTSMDAENNVTIYAYDGFGHHTRAIDPTGAYTIFEYDDADRQTAVKQYTSGASIQTHTVSAFDSAGRLTSTRVKATPGGADGNDDQLTQMQYDGEDRLTRRIVSIDVSNSVTTTNAYDGAGRLTSVTDGDGFNTTYEYDDDDNRILVTNPLSYTTAYAYDSANRQSRMTNHLGDYTDTTFDLVGRQSLVSQYDGSAVLLAKSKYDYDSAGRQTVMRRKSSPGGADSDSTDSVDRSLYDGDGQLTGRVSPSGNTTTYAYDQYDRQTKVTLPDGSYTTSAYNKNGVLTSQVRYEIVSGNTRSFRTDHVVDGLSRITSTINQGPDGTFANGDDLTTQYAYDAVGRQVTMTNEAGRFTVSEFNALGRKTRVTEDSAGLARITDSQFDRAGRLNKLIAYTDGTSNPQTTSYAYNGRGLQTIVTYEETGNVTQAYDSAGNMTLRTDEAGIAVEYWYDELNRLIQRNKASAVANIESYNYDGLGRLIDADIDDGSSTGSAFGYDALSRVTYENQTAGGTAKQINYTYDKGGNRISLKHDAWSKTLAYAYDSRDRCSQIDHVSGGTTVRMADYTWLGNALSRRDTTCDYPGSTKPKFKSDFQRDGILRISKITNEHLTYDQAGSTYGDLGTWDYTYDSSGNLLTGSQSGTMGASFLAVDNFHTYDTGDRLLTTRYDDPQAWDAEPVRTSWFSYDDLGNRISHKYRQASAIGYAHDKANRMTTLANRTQGYDLAGNLTLAFSVDRGTSYKYKYDHHNRLTGVYDSTGVTRKAAFTWDALGRRVEFWNDVQLATTRYWYDGVNEVHSYRLAGSPGSQAHTPHVFVHGVSYIDERLAMVNTVSNKPHYFVVDRMYNVRMVIDRAGAVVERYAYDSYGRPRIRESCGRGDLNDDTLMTSTDTSRFTSAKNGSIWDPRADMDDDGDVDSGDQTLYDAKEPDWASALDATAVVEQAFSDADNPFMFQGVPHFAIDTASNSTEDKLSLNHHRARFADCPTGRWVTRDSIDYATAKYSPNWSELGSFDRTISGYSQSARVEPNCFVFLRSSPQGLSDPTGWSPVITLDCDSLLRQPPNCCNDATPLAFEDGARIFSSGTRQGQSVWCDCTHHAHRDCFLTCACVDQSPPWTVEYSFNADGIPWESQEPSVGYPDCDQACTAQAPARAPEGHRVEECPYNNCDL
jgi:YD repeat-containing protein